ncbi:MAG: hypothetical protein OHK0048_13570 [Rhodoferax sp.]
MHAPDPILVTRVGTQAQTWVDALRKRGFNAQSLPLLATRALPDPSALRRVWQRLGDYAAVVPVSAQAVHYFFEQKPAPAHDHSAQAAPKFEYWVVGEGSRRALLAHGVEDARIITPAPNAMQWDSESLWAVVAPRCRPGQRALIVRGDDAAAPSPHGQGRDWLAQRLRQAGVEVDFVVAYVRALPEWSPEQRAAALGAVRAPALWLLSSAQSVQNLGQLLPQVDWRAAQALATHPRIAQAARSLGFGRVAHCHPDLTQVMAFIESWT